MSIVASSHSFLRAQRVLHDAESSSFDPLVFWSVNAMLITLLLVVLVWCFRGGAEKISIYLTREAGGMSDAAYLRRRRERREREAQEKKESPEQRLATLKKSFQRNKVQMVNNVLEKKGATAMVRSERQSFNVALSSNHVVDSNDFVEESVIEIVENKFAEEQEKELSVVLDQQTGKNETPHEEAEPSADVENGARIDEKDGKAVNVDEGEACAENDEHDFASTASVELGSPDAVESQTNTMNMKQDAGMGVELGSPAIEESNVDENNTVTEEERAITMNAVETGAPGYIKLRLASGKKRTVPNCCAVCLCCYEEGETVVWSSNRACKHAFHEECVMKWLIKMQDGTPCPCCRQEFTDVDKLKQRQKILHTGPTFDVSVIHL